MKRSLLCLFIFSISLCQASSIEKEFFNGEISTRLERFESYSLDQQWQIFLYGNQEIHPPVKSLALPIAKQGKPAFEFIVEQLRTSGNEPDFRDSLVVFERMQQGNYYNICGDPDALKEIRCNKMKINHPGWKEVYVQIFEGLCE